MKIAHHICLLLLPYFTYGQGSKTIVFVCEHGGARSTIASVYFNKLAKENHLPYQSIFLGLTPDSTITKETAQGLKSDGFDIATLRTKSFSPAELPSGALIISLDCNVPPSYHVDQSWTGISAISENYSAARNEILKHLNELTKELKSKEKITKTK